MESKQIDLRLTTTSMKLVEEKSLLRRKQHIRARLKELAGFESVMHDMQALKDKRTVLIIEKRDKATQVGEMRQGLRRLRLACRLGTSVRDLVTESIEVPREAIGRVIGKKRAALAQVEEECKVAAVEEFSRVEPPPAATRKSGPNACPSTPTAGAFTGSDTLTLHLSGTRDGVTEALRRLDITVRTMEVAIEAHAPLAAALRADRHALTHRLEEELCVKIFVSSTGPLSGAGCGNESTSSGESDGGSGVGGENG
ncbi:unnamed protein product, partial [Laminaria digitata]